MAVEIAGKVIEREISEEDHAKLIDEFIELSLIHIFLKLREVKSDDRFEWYSCILFSSAYLLFCLLRIRQFWDILSMKRRVFLCG